MGCDIHLYVERFRQGVWVPVDPPQRVSQTNKTLQELVREDGYWSDWGRYNEEVPELEQLMNAGEEDPYPRTAQSWAFGRNYHAFAMLADVRNRGDVEPFMPPRGFPDDISEEVWNVVTDGIEVNDYLHSESYFTLMELEEIIENRGDKDQETWLDGIPRILQLIEELKIIVKKHNLPHSNVRIVFCFDN